MKLPDQIISLREELKRSLENHYKNHDGLATLPIEITRLINPSVLLGLKICVTRYSCNYQQGPHATIPFDLCGISERLSHLPYILIYRYANGEFMICLKTTRCAVVFNTQTDKIWKNGNPVDSLVFNEPNDPTYTGIEAIARTVEWLLPNPDQMDTVN